MVSEQTQVVRPFKYNFKDWHRFYEEAMRYHRLTYVDDNSLDHRIDTLCEYMSEAVVEYLGALVAEQPQLHSADDWRDWAARVRSALREHDPTIQTDANSDGDVDSTGEPFCEIDIPEIDLGERLYKYDESLEVISVMSSNESDSLRSSRTSEPAHAIHGRRLQRGNNQSTSNQGKHDEMHESPAADPKCNMPFTPQLDGVTIAEQQIHKTGDEPADEPEGEPGNEPANEFPGPVTEVLPTHQERNGYDQRQQESISEACIADRIQSIQYEKNTVCNILSDRIDHLLFEVQAIFVSLSMGLLLWSIPFLCDSWPLGFFTFFGVSIVHSIMILLGLVSLKDLNNTYKVYIGKQRYYGQMVALTEHSPNQDSLNEFLEGFSSCSSLGAPPNDQEQWSAATFSGRKAGVLTELSLCKEEERRLICLLKGDFIMSLFGWSFTRFWCEYWQDINPVTLLPAFLSLSLTVSFVIELGFVLAVRHHAHMLWRSSYPMV